MYSDLNQFDSPNKSIRIYWVPTSHPKKSHHPIRPQLVRVCIQSLPTISQLGQNRHSKDVADTSMRCQ